jgi:hypothetical protein
MMAQYFDEAARYLPRWTLGLWGVVTVLSGLALSSFYLWRAIRGQEAGACTAPTFCLNRGNAIGERSGQCE